MTTAVIGATGYVGSEIVRGVLARGDPVSAILAGENDFTTEAFQQIAGPPARTLANFLHEYREESI